MTTFLGILSVPATLVLFFAVAIGTLWLMHGLTYLWWLAP